jgi:WD40 repeat protein
MKLMGGEVVLKGHQGTVLSINFNMGGTLIVTTSSDKTAKLWKLDGSLIKTFIGHTEEVHLGTISQNN